jgi:hypothetical protein
LPKDKLDGEKNKISYQTVLKFGSQDDAIIESKSDYRGIIGATVKQVLNSNAKEELKQILNDFLYSHLIPNLKIESYDYKDVTTISESFKIDYKISAKDYTNTINDLVIFNIPFLYPLQESATLQIEERKNDFYPEFVLNVDPCSESILVEIPEGNEVPKLPKDVIIEDKFFSYSLKFSNQDNDLKIDRSIVIKVIAVDKEEFDLFKESYSKIIKAESQKIYYSPM